LLYELHPALRGCPTEAIEERVDSRVITEINLRRNADVTSLLFYGEFKQVGYGDYNPTFLRYYFSRIESFIAGSLTWGIQDSLSKHILARNEESRELFRPQGARLTK
jgi:hypothetical protein